MKLNMTKFIGLLTLCLFTFGPLQAAPDVQGRQPVLDADGRFWVYRNGLAHPPMPFAPYGWMSDTTNLTQLIKIDLACVDNPNHAVKAAPGLVEKDTCIDTKITWGDATWASVAFISGPDKPPWWGESNRGRYYNLSGLAKKKLVFFARGGQGGETIKVQMGVLGDKPFGDSTHKPVASDDIVLTQEWTRHEIDLKDVPSAELEHICNGFGFVLERSSQAGSSPETVFYLDDIYFE
jgi:hypothetical protein